jgi:hypothetical protein
MALASFWGPKINLQLNVTFQKSPDNSQLAESKFNIHLQIVHLNQGNIHF